MVVVHGGDGGGGAGGDGNNGGDGDDLSSYCSCEGGCVVYGGGVNVRGSW